MEIKRLHLAFFSPTHTTRDCLRNMAKGIAAGAVTETEYHNLTFPDGRNTEIEIPQDELLIIGMPVYAGRIPGLFQTGLPLKGKGAAVCVVVYGNREYDDALLELVNLTAAGGFRVAAAAAFIAQHSLNPVMAKGRPDTADIRSQIEFGRKIAQRMAEFDAPDEIATIGVKGNPDYKPYKPVLLVPGLIQDRCISCRICAGACPMQIIDYDTFTVTAPEQCLFCNACATFCPREARALPGPARDMFTARMQQLAEKNQERKEPEIFI